MNITDKVARAEKHESLVCGNSDYIIEFTFDAEWDEYQTKTARFKFNDQNYIDVVFTGTRCPVPVLNNTNEVIVGVFAGDLKTTTPAYLRAQRSILCGSGAPVDPDPDVYHQIMQMIEDGKLRGEKGEKGDKGDKGDSGEGSVEVDTTLSVAGKAADAAATGKVLHQLSEEMADLKGNGVGGAGTDGVVRELLEVVPCASKNLNTSKYYSKEKDGVTFTVNPDNTVSLTGTPSANVSLFNGKAENIANGFTLSPGTYRLSGGIDGYVNLICYQYNDAGTLLSETVEIGYGKTITITEECTCAVGIQARANKTLDGITVKAQLEAGTVTTEYVSPFSEDKRSKRLDDIEKHIDDIENSGSGLADKLPDYWEKTSGYLTSKVETIRTLMRGCAERGDIFYFLTDAHWHLNEQHSPAIIAWLNEHINVPRMINGGDITDEYDEKPSRLYRKVMGNGEYYFADGNHEYLAGKTYADNFYANRMFADKAVYGDENRTYYYVDNPAGKMRYIVLATFGPWVDGSESMVLNTTEQKDWLKNVALNVEEGWTVIVFAHIYSIENGNYIAGGETMLSYMADMTKGEVACVIQGDQHSDYILPSYAGKIPIVCTTCDKNKGSEIEDLANRASGTIGEQAFDVVVVDKAQKQLHFVRIGYAKDGDEIRTVSYGTAN